jgi:hypothetical protein
MWFYSYKYHVENVNIVVRYHLQLRKDELFIINVYCPRLRPKVLKIRVRNKRGRKGRAGATGGAK